MTHVGRKSKNCAFATFAPHEGEQETSYSGCLVNKKRRTWPQIWKSWLPRPRLCWAKYRWDNLCITNATELVCSSYYKRRHDHISRSASQLFMFINVGKIHNGLEHSGKYQAISHAVTVWGFPSNSCFRSPGHFHGSWFTLCSRVLGSFQKKKSVKKLLISPCPLPVLR